MEIVACSQGASASRSGTDGAWARISCKTLTRRLTLNSALLAVTIAATAYGFALTGGNLSVLLVLQAAVLLIPALSLVTPGHRNFDSGNLLRWAIVSATVLLSVLANIGAYPFGGTTAGFAVTHAIGIVGTLFALQWAATSLSPEKLMQRLAVLLFPLIALAIGVALHEGGWILRAAPFGVHPNWWGELAFAATASALALRSRNLRALLIGTALLLLVVVQSRGALLATCASIAMYALLSLRWKSFSRARLAGLLALTILAIVGLLFAQSAVWRTWVFFSDAVLLLNDPYRGLDTGLTGRVAGWSAAIDIAVDNPILGHGLDTLDRVHNGFLQLMGEGGVILLLVVLTTMALASYNAVKGRNYLAVSIIFGYVLYAMTFPRMLNMNVTSMLFYLCLFSWRRMWRPSVAAPTSDRTPMMVNSLTEGSDSRM